MCPRVDQGQCFHVSAWTMTIPPGLKAPQRKSSEDWVSPPLLSSCQGQNPWLWQWPGNLLVYRCAMQRWDLRLAYQRAMPSKGGQRGLGRVGMWKRHKEVGSENYWHFTVQWVTKNCSPQGLLSVAMNHSMLRFAGKGNIGIGGVTPLFLVWVWST